MSDTLRVSTKLPHPAVGTARDGRGSEKHSPHPDVASGERDVPTGLSQRLVWPLASTIFVGSFIFRLLDPYFTNDHFRWILGGRLILAYGELPFRDFFDPGYLLQHFASAMAQQIFGYNLLGEALLSICFLSLGAALTFVLSSKASNSLVIGLIVTVLSIALYPRLYNYPKVSFYVLGLFLCWRYADRTTIGRLVVLALVTAAAFLFRHDHAVYIGAAAIATLVSTHWKHTSKLLQRLALYGSVVAVSVLPFFVFLQANGGIVEYFRAAVDWVGARRGGVGQWPAFTIDASAPLMTLDAAGTDGANSRLAAPPSQSLFGNVERVIPLLRVRIAPGLFQTVNATAWLYYLFVILPAIAFVVLALKLIRSKRGMDGMPAETPRILSAAVLCAVAVPLLLRQPLQARFADVAPPVAVLGAWLLGQTLRSASKPHRFAPTGLPRLQRWVSNPQWVVRLTLTSVLYYGAAVLILFFTWLSVTTVAQGSGGWLAKTGAVSGFSAMSVHAAQTFKNLEQVPPSEHLYPAGPGRQLARYVRECTQPADRLLLTWFAPELYFYSGRAPAGGQIAPDGRHLEKVRWESVPIVIAALSETDSFRSILHNIDDVLRTDYHLIFESTFGSDRLYRIFAHNRLVSSGLYEPWSLPCYR